MKRRTLITLIMALTAIGCSRAMTPATAVPSPRLIQQQPKHPEKPKPHAAPKPKPSQPAPKRVEQPRAKAETNYSGQVSMKLEQGGKIIVANRRGHISIKGWERDMVQAKATSDEGAEPVQVQRVSEASQSRIVLAIPSEAFRHGREVMLEVMVPRYAELEKVETHHGDVVVTGVEGAIYISNSNGDVRASQVGSLRVGARNGEVIVDGVKGDFVGKSSNGSISAQNVTGTVDVTASSGDVNIRNVGSDVRAVSASGDITIHCAKGGVESGTSSGSITLTGVGGNANAETASGDVIFRGPIRATGRYRLKTLSGGVEMIIQPDPPGFTAFLKTYTGEIETAFPLKVVSPFGPINKNMKGVYGDGQAQLELDSFSGTVRIAKGTAAALKECK